MERTPRASNGWRIGSACVLPLVVAGIAYPAQTFAQPGNDAEARADIVIVHAKVWTGVKEPAARTLSALAIAGSKIIAVGDETSIRGRIGPSTRVIDAAGRRVIPGITDSHTHIVGGGLQLARLHLRDAKDKRAFVRAIEDAAKKKQPGQWLLGGRWSVDSWADPSSPNKGWLDPITGDVPIFLTRMDGHQALVNSAALRVAGIDSKGPADPAGGEIERDPAIGEPTGILKESAMGLVSRHVPEPSPEELDIAFGRAMRHANSLGVTSTHTMCSRRDLDVFRRAYRDGAMTLRINAFLSASDWGAFAEEVASFEPNTDMLRLLGFKGFMDGSLGSRTAYMREKYSDATPDTRYPRGQLTDMADPPESFKELVATADARRLQLAVHAIGDMGNHLLLDAYEYAAKRNGPRDARHRAEHAQHLLLEDIPRFAKLGVVASMQPLHKADDGRYAELAIGRDRLKGSYAYRQLLDAGAIIVFGSDWPVVSLDPFAGIDAAVNARTLENKIFLPTHSMTVEEALTAYTAAPPFAVHAEAKLGTIEVGKLADLVILTEDPLTISKDKLGTVRAALTVVDGRVVYERNKAP